MNRELEKIENYLIPGLGKKENQNKFKVRLLNQNWPEIVGEAMAAHSSPYKLEGKELWITADPGGWLQNITLMSGMILPKINEWWGEEGVILKLKIIGRREERTFSFFSEPEPEKVPDIRIEKSDIELASSEAESIQDDKLREKFIQALSVAKAKERIAREKGLPTCNRCGIFIEADEVVCRICEGEEKAKRLQKMREYLNTAPWLSPNELAAWAKAPLFEARDVRRNLLGDLAARVLPGEEMSHKGLILVMLITRKQPAELDEATVKTVWNRIQRKIRNEILEKIQDRLVDLPLATYEEITEDLPISLKEFEIARRDLLMRLKKEVKPEKEVSLLGLKAAMLVTHQKIEIWEEERIRRIWEQIRKGGIYVFKYRPGKINSPKRNRRDS